MCVEGDEIADAHIPQLGEGIGAVQRFPAAAFVLSPLIEKGHDDIDSGSFAVAGRDDALQVLKMVVWRHMVDEAVHVVGDAMVADIHHQKQILPSDGLSENCLPFAAAESGCL